MVRCGVAGLYRYSPLHSLRWPVRERNTPVSMSTFAYRFCPANVCLLSKYSRTTAMISLTLDPFLTMKRITRDIRPLLCRRINRIPSFTSVTITWRVPYHAVSNETIHAPTDIQDELLLRNYHNHPQLLFRSRLSVSSVGLAASDPKISDLRLHSLTTTFK